MTALRYTLVTDGSSDRALLAVLEWFWRVVLTTAAKGEWLDPRLLPSPATSLEERIRAALDLYPCEVLFVHRDAERCQPVDRCREIQAAMVAAARTAVMVPHVCVVPVRMTEAWFLFDESAIRRAAGNPNGTTPLDLPPLDRLEQLPDPKSLLFAALRTASGLAGRRLKKLNEAQLRARLAELLSDFSPLRQLAAFAKLESDITTVAARVGSPTPSAATTEQSR